MNFFRSFWESLFLNLGSNLKFFRGNKDITKKIHRKRIIWFQKNNFSENENK